MSSLIDTSSKETSSIAALSTIAGRQLPTHVIPKRQYTGSRLTNLANSKEHAISFELTSDTLSDDNTSLPPRTNGKDSRIVFHAPSRASRPLSFQKTSETGASSLSLTSGLKEQKEYIGGFISLLEASHGCTQESMTERDMQINDLITAMKAHSVSKDTVKQTNGITTPKIWIDTHTVSSEVSPEKDRPHEVSLPYSPDSPRMTEYTPSSTDSITFMPTNATGATKISIVSSSPHSSRWRGEGAFASDDDRVPAIASRAYMSDSFEYMNRRKILPLPKRRWKRKLSKMQTEQQPGSSTHFGVQAPVQGNSIAGLGKSVGTPPLEPKVWQLTPPGQEIQYTFTLAESQQTWRPATPQGLQQFSNLGSSLGGEDHAESRSAVETSYRDNAKKMKRSANGQSSECVSYAGEEDDSKTPRQEQQPTLGVQSTTGPSPFPEIDFTFCVDSQSRPLKQLPKYSEVPLALPYLTLYQTAGFGPVNDLAPKNSVMSQKTRKSVPNGEGKAVVAHAFGTSVQTGGPASKGTTQGMKTTNVAKPSSSAASARPTLAKKVPAEASRVNEDSEGNRQMTEKLARKAKKGQKKKKAEDDGDGMAALYSTSDFSLVRNPDPNDWTCLFCQFEIFVRDLESARRKGGYYQRMRERRRRLKEAEARRHGETMSAGTSDVEEDDHLIPFGGLPGPGKDIVAHHQQNAQLKGHRAG